MFLLRAIGLSGAALHSRNGSLRAGAPRILCHWRCPLYDWVAKKTSNVKQRTGFSHSAEASESDALSVSSANANAELLVRARLLNAHTR